MIIQCEQCQTKFRLDDAKITGRGVKVRCSKCRHVFPVRSEEPQSGTAFADLLGQYGEPAPEGGAAVERPVAPAAGAEPAVAGEGERESGLPGAEEFSFSAAPAEEGPSPPSAQAVDFDFSFDAGQDEAETSQVAGAPSADVGEGKMGAGSEVAFTLPSVTVPADDQQAVEDFVIDFGELNAPQEGAGPEPGRGAERDTFNLDFDDLLGGTSGETASTPGIGFDEGAFPAASLPQASEGAGGGLDFSDLDLGELPAPSIDAQGPAAGQAESEGAGRPESGAAASIQMPSADEESDLPPLIISSRRKGASFFPAAVTVAAIFFVVILAGIGFLVVSGPETMKKLGLDFLVPLTGGEIQEEGKISLAKVAAEFVANKEAGELFVVRGETVNSYSKPRASIQVRATLLGANGQAIVNKLAYCGNNLTKEQLEALPLAKIEEVMNNQFGDSLSNLGVQPGKSIPFVVVFANVPKEAVDFTVSVAGSTVAAK